MRSVPLPMRLLATLALVAVAVAAVAAADDASPPLIAVHRAVQIDRSSGGRVAEAGSRASRVKGAAALFDPTSPTTAVGHAVLVVDVFDVAEVTATPADFLALSTAGFLFLLPPAPTASERAPLPLPASQRFVAALEAHVASVAVPLPVYFARWPGRTAALADGFGASAGADNVTALVAALRSARGANAGGRYISLSLLDTSAAATTPAKAPAPALPVTSVALRPRASSKDGKDETILIVAHADTLSAAPGLASGGGSGAAVWMELLRLFSRVYAGAANASAGSAAPSRGVTFLLTSGARLSYAGLRQWLQGQGPGVGDAFGFALCLEDVVSPVAPAVAGAEDGADKAALFLHTARKDGTGAAALDALAPSDGTGRVHRAFGRIDVAAGELKWEHEPLAHRRMPAATLSAIAAPRPQALRAPLLPRNASLDDATAELASVAKLLASWLASAVGLPAAAAAEAASGVSAAHLRAWEAFHRTHARSAVAPDGAVAGVYRDAIRDATAPVRALRSPAAAKGAAAKAGAAGAVATVAVSSHDFAFQSDASFYGPFSVTLAVHESRTVAVEAALLLAAVAYVYFVGSWFLGGAATREAVLSLWSSRGAPTATAAKKTE